mmetsp:Transcript_7564/g.18012  ORF Transcript_7564/g.18012 Transcript_7564/m.18012 type:complete len:285 (+) Transcript_7564:581-1435(+)
MRRATADFFVSDPACASKSSMARLTVASHRAPKSGTSCAADADPSSSAAVARSTVDMTNLRAPWEASPRRRAAARSTGLARPHEAAAPDRSRSVTADETALAAVAGSVQPAPPFVAHSSSGIAAVDATYSTRSNTSSRALQRFPSGWTMDDSMTAAAASNLSRAAAISFLPLPPSPSSSTTTRTLFRPAWPSDPISPSPSSAQEARYRSTAGASASNKPSPRSRSVTSAAYTTVPPHAWTVAATSATLRRPHALATTTPAPVDSSSSSPPMRLPKAVVLPSWTW